MSEAPNGLLGRVIRLEERWDFIQEDYRELKDALNTLIIQIEHAKLDAARERKADRRWLTGALLTTAGLVIAAMGVLAGTGAFS